MNSESRSLKTIRLHITHITASIGGTVVGIVLLHIVGLQRFAAGMLDSSAFEAEIFYPFFYSFLSGLVVAYRLLADRRHIFFLDVLAGACLGILAAVCALALVDFQIKASGQYIELIKKHGLGAVVGYCLGAVFPISAWLYGIVAMVASSLAEKAVG